MSHEPSDKHSRQIQPCPFCGSPGELHYSSDHEIVNVRCMSWGPSTCLGAGQNCHDEGKAIDTWNRRAALSHERAPASICGFKECVGKCYFPDDCASGGPRSSTRTPSKVFVVVGGWSYEGYDVPDGIFETQEKAEAALKMVTGYDYKKVVEYELNNLVTK